MLFSVFSALFAADIPDWTGVQSVYMLPLPVYSHMDVV